jgi:hypothetical protein
MVKPLKSVARPAAPTKPAELPSGIFYAVVMFDSSESLKPKKMSSRIRNDFDHYVVVNSSPAGWALDDVPTLFTTLAKAQNVKTIVALDYEDTESVQVFIQTFRLVESTWSPGVDTWTARRRDACDMAEGVMAYDKTAEQVKKLAGKVLTILDAAYMNDNQNKAVKDLVKSCFRSQLSDMWKVAYADPNSDCSEGVCQKDILDD